MVQSKKQSNTRITLLAKAFIEKKMQDTFSFWSFKKSSALTQNNIKSWTKYKIKVYLKDFQKSKSTRTRGYKTQTGEKHIIINSIFFILLLLSGRLTILRKMHQAWETNTGWKRSH